MHRIAVVDNFISPSDAETLINEMNNPSEINQYPDYYLKRYGGTALPYNRNVIDILSKYSDKANILHKDLNGFRNSIYTYKAFGSKWQPGQSGGVHSDAEHEEPWIEWSTVIYLNDSSEYDGGIIFFPNQEFSYRPKRYSAVLFPSAGSEYIHGITELNSGNRYTALFMHTSNRMYADPDLIGESMWSKK